MTTSTVDVRRAEERFHTRAGWLGGFAQRMSAGRGIWHSEKNWSRSAEVHFLQMWVLPDTPSVYPGYQQVDVTGLLDAGGLVPIASGRDHVAAISIRQRDATLWVARLQPGERVEVPEAEFGHVFVARGAAELEATGTLATGDAARLTRTDAMDLAATDDGAEVLVWTTGDAP